MNKLVKNSEILYLYGAKLCNPNGDPDEENRPRMDPKTSTNLVSDLRLKRYIRDHIIRRFGEKYVWVSTVGGKVVASDERGWSLLEQWAKTPGIPKDIGKADASKWTDLIPKLCIDARLFGATIAIRKRQKAKGAMAAFIGPVQFTWGFSLHPVELVESSTITSIFMGREAEGTEERYGTMGKDWRLYYSLIAFYGLVSGARAKGTGLRAKDVELLDNMLWDALLQEAVSRSKIGQLPHLYLRVEYKDAETLNGDLRRHLECKPTTKSIRDVEHVPLSHTKLVKALKSFKDRIACIYIRESGELVWTEGKALTEALKDDSDLGKLVTLLPHRDFPVEKTLSALET